MTTAFDVVLKQIDDDRETRSRALVTGGAKSYDEYRHLCGEIQGLSRAHAYITDLVRKLERDDD
jgi:hypothetical protein